MRYAQDLGAKVVNDVRQGVTHVVAARDGTEKVSKGKTVPGCAVVRRSWLMECYWTLTRRNVEPHLMAPILKQTTGTGGGLKLLLSGSEEEESSLEDEDEEDDSFLMSEVEKDVAT
mmetsp:Transcript_6798/g.8427  ORF Transcript_6798/g.8427 Transcript_6798/m.8427 type:complete len:116 (+) Transcript_6798:101-448(+)